MSIVTLTPAASEPVSLAEAKLFLRIDHDDEDALVAALIAAAREAVEAGCGRALVTRQVRETQDDWDREPNGAVRLGLGPVSAIVAVRLVDAEGAATALSAASYRLDGARDRPRLVFAAGPPTPLRASAGIEIDYDAGFSTAASGAPAALRLAVLHIAAALYEARQGEAAIPEAARALMRPFAPARL